MERNGSVMSSSSTQTAAAIAAETAADTASAHARHTTVAVGPAMCGPTSLFAGWLGDLTWSTVSEQCGIDVLRARNDRGAPAYLAFYYIHLRGSRTLHPGALTFGDRLSVSSGCFNEGSESVLTLHRLSLAGGADERRPLDPVEFGDAPREDCIYAQVFNRWISRTAEAENTGLVTASPPGFRAAHLPAIPARYSPRAVYQRARQTRSFRDAPAGGDAAAGGAEAGAETEAPALEIVLDHEVDVTRDVNGVGLLYFASYFAMVDRAVLAVWRKLGRDDASFLRRIVLDQKICFLGNADIDSRMSLTARFHPAADRGGDAIDPGDIGVETLDVVAVEKGTERVLAVSTLQFAPQHTKETM